MTEHGQDRKPLTAACGECMPRCVRSAARVTSYAWLPPRLFGQHAQQPRTRPDKRALVFFTTRTSEPSLSYSITSPPCKTSPSIDRIWPAITSHTPIHPHPSPITSHELQLDADLDVVARVCRVVRMAAVVRWPSFVVLSGRAGGRVVAARASVCERRIEGGCLIERDSTWMAKAAVL